MILSWKGKDGKRKGKSISTGLPVKGNKKRAEAILLKTRKEFNPDNLMENADMLSRTSSLNGSRTKLWRLAPAPMLSMPTTSKLHHALFPGPSDSSLKDDGQRLGEFLPP